MPRRTSKTPLPAVPPKQPGVPAYRRKVVNRRVYAVVTIDRHDVYLGDYATAASIEKYNAAVAAWLANGRRAPEPERPALVVSELILRYLEYAESYYRDRDGGMNAARIANIERVLRPLRVLYGLTPAAEFGPRKLELVQARLVSEGLSRPTVNRYVARVRHVFKWGVARELVPPSVHHALTAFEGLKRGRTDAPETEPVRPVPDALVDAVQPHVSRQVWGLIELQRFTGCRPGEAVRCRAVDIDMSGPVWLWKVTELKLDWRGTERVVAIGPKGQDVIRRFMRADVNAYLFDPREAEAERRDAMHKARKTPASCGNRPGTNRRANPRRRPHERYTTMSYARAIRRACDLAFPAPAGLADDERRTWRREHTWAPNQIRHAFATAVRRQYGLEQVGACLGHSKLETSQLYAERDRALAIEVAQRIG
ncbi:MAG: site-specific integrase [Phycisphaerae bacterium]|nr:site-specific integrase [Phycisphaerae bacterium]